MFERFTEKAIASMVRAQQGGRDLQQNYLGSELILLALCSQADGLASQV
jgi:hypothetical protein